MDYIIFDDYVNTKQFECIYTRDASSFQPLIFAYISAYVYTKPLCSLWVVRILIISVMRFYMKGEKRGGGEPCIHLQHNEGPM